jgi:hypothetical protein
MRALICGGVGCKPVSPITGPARPRAMIKTRLSLNERAACRRQVW